MWNLKREKKALKIVTNCINRDRAVAGKEKLNKKR